jgi:arylsulfatase
LKCGRDAGSQITSIYKPPFAFTGSLEKVMVDVSGERIEDHEAEIRVALARQ